MTLSIISCSLMIKKLTIGQLFLSVWHKWPFSGHPRVLFPIINEFTIKLFYTITEQNIWVGCSYSVTFRPSSQLTIIVNNLMKMLRQIPFTQASTFFSKWTIISYMYFTALQPQVAHTQLIHTYFWKKTPEYCTFWREVKKHPHNGLTTEKFKPFCQPCKVVK